MGLPSDAFLSPQTHLSLTRDGFLFPCKRPHWLALTLHCPLTYLQMSPLPSPPTTAALSPPREEHGHPSATIRPRFFHRHGLSWKPNTEALGRKVTLYIPFRCAGWFSLGPASVLWPLPIVFKLWTERASLGQAGQHL